MQGYSIQNDNLTIAFNDGAVLTPFGNGNGAIAVFRSGIQRKMFNDKNWDTTANLLPEISEWQLRSGKSTIMHIETAGYQCTVLNMPPGPFRSELMILDGHKNIQAVLPIQEKYIGACDAAYNALSGVSLPGDFARRVLTPKGHSWLALNSVGRSHTNSPKAIPA